MVLRFSYGFSIVLWFSYSFLWFYSFSMVFLWFSFGAIAFCFVIMFLLFSYGFRFYYAFPVFLWLFRFSYCFPVFLWFSGGFPMGAKFEGETPPEEECFQGCVSSPSLAQLVDIFEQLANNQM